MTVDKHTEPDRPSRMATAQIAWMSYSNEDIGSDRPDEGWYITADLADGTSVSIGPDPVSGPGFASVDEALAYVEKWATDRNMSSHRPVIDVAVTRVHFEADESLIAEMCADGEHGPSCEGAHE